MDKRYVYNKQAGALQEAAAPPVATRTRVMPMRMSSAAQSIAPAQMHTADDLVAPQEQRADDIRLARAPRPGDDGRDGRDPTRSTRRPGMFSYTIEDGEHVLMIHKDGTMEELVGPKRVSTFGRTFRRMEHYVAHPGEFLVVRYRDGRQEHLVGPAHLWLDPRKHLAATREEGLQLAAKEAVVIYERAASGQVTRRVLQGPAVFVAQPGARVFFLRGNLPAAGGRWSFYSPRLADPESVLVPAIDGAVASLAASLDQLRVLYPTTRTWVLGGSQGGALAYP